MTTWTRSRTQETVRYGHSAIKLVDDVITTFEGHQWRTIVASCETKPQYEDVP